MFLLKINATRVILLLSFVDRYFGVKPSDPDPHARVTYYPKSQ